MRYSSYWPVRWGLVPLLLSLCLAVSWWFAQRVSLWTNNLWALVHLACLCGSLLVFGLSFLLGLGYLQGHYRLKHKKLANSHHGPSLLKLEAWHDQALYTAFVLLTLGIMTGAGWSKTVYGVYVVSSVKQIGAFAAWAFYALFLHRKQQQGWVGTRGIVLSSLGFIGVVLLFSWVARG
jgi:ABC-type uncharacterized transport system permease subunit